MQVDLRDALPHVKAKSSSSGKVPDFMILEPSEQQKQYEAVKTQLVNVLKPTPEMVQSVSSNPELLAGEKPFRHIYSARHINEHINEHIRKSCGVLHFMICHSNKCHRPRTSSCHKEQRGGTEYG